ncbi:MAG: hypothetical protein AAB209_00765, partial [Bacteroidota bacterium]
MQLAPLDGAVKVTVSLGTGLLNLSRTLTRNGAGNWVPTTVDSGPETVTMENAGPGVFVNENTAGVAFPGTLAGNEYGPAVLFAVKGLAVAKPSESVEAVYTPPWKNPL